MKNRWEEKFNIPKICNFKITTRLLIIVVINNPGHFWTHRNALPIAIGTRMVDKGKQYQSAHMALLPSNLFRVS